MRRLEDEREHDQRDRDDDRRGHDLTPRTSRTRSPCRRVKVEIATGTVYLSGVWVNESAKRNSFQAAMKARRPVVTRPGATSGSSTR